MVIDIGLFPFPSNLKKEKTKLSSKFGSWVL